LFSANVFLLVGAGFLFSSAAADLFAVIVFWPVESVSAWRLNATKPQASAQVKNTILVVVLLALLCYCAIDLYCWHCILFLIGSWRRA